MHCLFNRFRKKKKDYLKTGAISPVFFVFCNENNLLVKEVLQQHF